VESEPSSSIELTLRLRLGAEPISGCLEGERGVVSDFSGLLELVSLLDTIRRSGPAPAETVPR
jgi:hypothetical protein